MSDRCPLDCRPTDQLRGEIAHHVRLFHTTDSYERQERAVRAIQRRSAVLTERNEGWSCEVPVGIAKVLSRRLYDARVV